MGRSSSAQCFKQSRPGSWPLVVTWSWDINTDHSCSRTTDPDMVLGRSLDQNLTMRSQSFCLFLSLQFHHSVQHAPSFPSLYHILSHYSCPEAGAWLGVFLLAAAELFLGPVSDPDPWLRASKETQQDRHKELNQPTTDNVFPRGLC